MHGRGEEALRVFSHMLDLGVKPDNVVITAVLSACSHAGLVNEGLKIFNSIEEVHGVKPTMEQYACVVDLLARGGQIEDAFSFVSRMPIEANASIWGTPVGCLQGLIVRWNWAVLRQIIFLKMKVIILGTTW